MTTISVAAILLLTTSSMASIKPAYSVPAEGSVLATLTGCCGSGVGVGFDGVNLYWMDFSGATLHKIMTNGTFVADIPITGGSATVISWDATRNVFWGAQGTNIYKIASNGTATLAFSVAGNLPGDCNNGFGCLSLVDGLNYDGSDDSIWYSPDASQRAYHYATNGTLLGFVDVNVPPNDMAPVCGFNYNSGVATGSDILYLGANGCNHIFKYAKNGTLLNSFSIGTGRTEDMECDDITFAANGTDAIWTKDAFDTELIAFAVPQSTCKFGGGTAFTAGFMTGGGSIIDPTVGKVTHGFELQCNSTKTPNNLEVNWGKGNNFHLDAVTTATCSDDPSITPTPPKANFDTYKGTGTGKLNGKAGATIEWTFTDAGEPGKNDSAKIIIKDSSSTTVLSVSGNLKSGNQQAHNR